MSKPISVLKDIVVTNVTLTSDDLARLANSGDQRVSDLGITGMQARQGQWAIKGFFVEGEEEELSLGSYPSSGDRLIIGTCAQTIIKEDFRRLLYNAGFGTTRFSALLRLIVQYPQIVLDRKNPIYSLYDEYVDDNNRYRFIIGVKVVKGKFVFCKFHHHTNYSKRKDHSLIGKDFILYERP